MYKKYALICICLLLSGCSVSKVVTVPMRVVGSVVSVIPVVGNVVDGALDVTADVIDIVPLP